MWHTPDCSFSPFQISWHLQFQSWFSEGPSVEWALPPHLSWKGDPGLDPDIQHDPDAHWSSAWSWCCTWETNTYCIVDKEWLIRYWSQHKRHTNVSLWTVCRRQKDTCKADNVKPYPALNNAASALFINKLKYGLNNMNQNYMTMKTMSKTGICHKIVVKDK